MIYIFGDSFCEDTYCEDEEQRPPYPYIWTQKLREIENVKNFCQSGVGPVDQFKIFWEYKEQIFSNKSNKIVFLLSNPFRLTFDFLQNPPGNSKELGDYMIYFYHLFKDNKSKFSRGWSGDTDPEYFKEHQFLLNTFYDFFGDELFNLNYKNVMTLKCLSMIYKIKIMVFICFTQINPKYVDNICVDDNNMLTENYKRDDFFDILQKLNDYYFRFYSTPLRFYAGDYPDLNSKVKPTLEQHLFEKDHQIVFNIVSNHLYDKSASEKFEDRNPQTGRFIYQ